MMYSKKRGQITSFIIIGVIILVFTSVFIYVRYSFVKGDIESQTTETLEETTLPPLENYVTQCIQKASEKPIKDIGRQGGSLDPGDFIYHNGSRLNFLCKKESPETACVNSLLTRQQMEFELQQAIAKNLKECVDLDNFRRQGVRVGEGDIDVKVSIGDLSIKIDVDYPINVTQEERITRVDFFTTTVKSPLGRLYSIAMDIVNHEITEGDFDKDTWMVRNNVDAVIHKHRPYPNKIYLLEKDDYWFDFGIEGSPTVGSRKIVEKTQYGCCYNEQDNTCFANVPSNICLKYEGSPSGDSTCTCPYSPEPGAVYEYADCIREYPEMTTERGISGAIEVEVPPPETKSHGESWCEYDSITGKGYDYVGSRHYKYSCIDGQILVEECRDYREELCTETASSEDKPTEATCRVNRWYDCSSCTTKECCEDTSQRDCHWNGWLELESDNKCTPEVPPGFRFWERQGGDICYKANQKKDCEGLSCPNNFVDSAAIACYKQGDCGNYRNTAGYISSFGFFESDFMDDVRRYVFLPDGYNINYGKWKLNLPMEADVLPEIMSEEPETPIGNVPMLLSAGLNFLDDLFKLQFSDFLKPFTGEPAVNVVDFTSCNLWVSPKRMNMCQLCTANPERPCTEYKCNSLGELCVFDYNNGNPACTMEYTQDNEPPTIEADIGAMSRNYNYEPEDLEDAKGYHVDKKIRPHEPFVLAIKTNEDTICKMDWWPVLKIIEGRTGFFSIPSLWVGEPIYNTTHKMDFRSPPRVEVPQKILDFMNFTDTDDFVGTLDTINTLYGHYKKNYRKGIKLYETFSGQNVLDQLDIMVDKIMDTIRMMVPKVKNMTKRILQEYADGGYYIFVTCIDRAGNMNEDQFFFRFEIDENYKDKDPPEIVKIIPETGSIVLGETEVKVYLNEPADCRYDAQDEPFDSMNKSFDCVSSYYQLSPVEGGTYECKKKIDVKNNYNKIFIRCKDNPLNEERYSLKLIEGNNFKIIPKTNNTSYNQSLYAENIDNAGSSLSISADYLDNIKFEVDPIVRNAFDMRLFIDDEMNCRYSQKTPSYDDMENNFSTCIKGPESQIQRGQYVCDANNIPIESKALNNSIGRHKLVVMKTNASSRVLQSQSTVKSEIVNNKLDLGFNKQLSGMTRLESNSSLALDLSLQLSGDCKYSTQDVGFTSMIGMDCEKTETNSLCHVSLGALADNSTFYFECNADAAQKASHKYNIACEQISNKTRNVMNESQPYVLKKGEELRFIGLIPTGNINADADGNVELSVTLNKNIDRYEIDCGYAVDPRQGLIKMAKSGDDQYKAVIHDIDPGRYGYYVMCEDNLGSIASDTIRFEVFAY